MGAARRSGVGNLALCQRAVATFLDTGQVFNDFKDVSFKDYRMTPGIGLRGIVRPNVVGRIDYGYSKEGGAIFAGLDFPY